MTPEIIELEKRCHQAIARIARSSYAAKKLHAIWQAIALVEGYKRKDQQKTL